LGKIPSYSALTAPTDNDLLVIEDMTSSSTKKITRGNFLSGTPLPANTVNTQAVADGAITSPKVANGFVVQVVKFQTGAVATGSTAMIVDDTIPQNTEGDEFMSLAITPKSASNILVIEIKAMITSATADKFIVGALYQDSTANALAAVYDRVVTTAGTGRVLPITHTMTAGTTSATTFKFRAGANTATITFNGTAGGRIFGGVMASSIVITEYKA
jgi:hypothetical protein